MNITKAIEQLGNRDSKKIANNTYLVPVADPKLDGSGVAVRLHNTNIVTFFMDRTVINTGGWRTVTTKRRINEYLEHGGIVQINRDWFWAVQDAEKPAFEEGDEIIQLAGDYRFAVRDRNGLVKGTF